MATIERKASGSSITDEKSLAVNDIVNEKGPLDHHLPTLPAQVDAADIGDVSDTVFLLPLKLTIA